MTIAFPPESTTATRHSTLPDRPPLSPKKLAANRANAQKSTGPRTPAGKQTASRNATTHNLTGKTPPPIADPNYATRLYELQEEHRPNTPSEHYLVEHLAHLGWKLDQIPRLEAQAMHDASPDDFRLDAASFAAPTALSRLWDLHRRLLAQFQSILRQLPALRRQQRQHHQDDCAAAERDRLLDSGQKIDRYCAAMETQTPAQNEPTKPSPSPSDSSFRLHPSASASAPHGATKTHTAPQFDAQAQNEPKPPATPHPPQPGQPVLADVPAHCVPSA